MDIDVLLLTDNVGLKFDDSVILGRENVQKFIEENFDKFQNLDLSRIDESHMLYGYNEFGNPIKIGFNKDGIERIIIFTKSEPKTRFRGVIAYDGHKYAGFQIQANQATIQGVLTDIVSSINGSNTLIQGCSRTDTGVHANNYVFHFDGQREITAKRWKQLLNYRLPNDILVKGIEQVHPLFHSRYDVYKKRYIYKIRLGERNPFQANYEWVLSNLNLDLIQKNLKHLIGTHDFSSFCKGNPDDTIRTLMSAELIMNDDEISLVFEGDGVLRYMVRIIVFALVEIASGKLDMDIEAIIKEKNRAHTKHMAPACGLYLDEIIY